MNDGPVPVGDLAQEWARRRGLRSAIALGIGDPGVWRDLVGDDLAAAGRPIRCEAGVLYLQANDRMGAARLRYAEGAIRAVCNESLGDDVIRRIVVREPSRRSGSSSDAW